MLDNQVGNTRRGLLRWQAWFYFFNTSLLLVIGLKYFSLQPWPSEYIAQVFILFSYPTHFLMLAMAPLLVTGLISIFFPYKKFIAYLCIFFSMLLLVIVGLDSLVFELYRFHFNGMVWSLVSNGGIFEIIPISWIMWLIILFGVAVILFLLLKIAAFVDEWVQTDYEIGLRVFIGAIVMIFSTQLLHAWGDANNYSQLTKQVRYLPGFKPVTMKRFLQSRGVASSSEKKIDLPDVGSALNYPRNPLQCEPEQKKKNILIVTIDSWRFDMLNEQVTPNMWPLVDESINFTQHISSGNATRYGIFGIFYGLYGSYWHSMMAEERGPVLIDELMNQGYQFSINASARLTSPEFDRTVFSELRGEISLKTAGKNAAIRDETITKNFIQFLQKRETSQPFFSFLFYDSPHSYEYSANAEAPFQPIWKTINYLSLNNDFDPIPFKNRFLNAIHFDDSLIGKVLRELRQQQLMDDTIIIFTGDHGEEFNENKTNYWGHNGNYTKYQIQVPMVVYWPGKVARTVDYKTSHLDIVPSLLIDALGCKNPISDYSHGKNMFEPYERPYFFLSNWNHFALVSDDLIEVVFDTGQTEQYDLTYRPVDRPKRDFKITKQVMDELSMFYAK